MGDYRSTSEKKDWTISDKSRKTPTIDVARGMWTKGYQNQYLFNFLFKMHNLFNSCLGSSSRFWWRKIWPYAHLEELYRLLDRQSSLSAKSSISRDYPYVSRDSELIASLLHNLSGSTRFRKYCAQVGKVLGKPGANCLNFCLITAIFLFSEFPNQ